VPAELFYPRGFDLLDIGRPLERGAEWLLSLINGAVFILLPAIDGFLWKGACHIPVDMWDGGIDDGQSVSGIGGKASHSGKSEESPCTKSRIFQLGLLLVRERLLRRPAGKALRQFLDFFWRAVPQDV
jgi:hypothetical protein